MDVKSTRKPSWKWFSFILLIGLVLVGVVAFTSIIWNLRMKTAEKLVGASLESYSKNDLALATILALESQRIYPTNASTGLISLLRDELIKTNYYTYKTEISEQSINIYSIAWSPSGQLALGSIDGAVFIWDIEIDQPVDILQGHQYAVTSLAWSQDGRLISGSADHDIIFGIYSLQNR